MFGEKYHDYFRKNINLKIGSWLNDLTVIIEADCLRKIKIAIKNEENGILVLQYLVQKNDIVMYKTFIELWKKHDSAIANQFEINLNDLIQARGLTEINESFQVKCKYLAAYNATI